MKITNINGVKMFVDIIDSDLTNKIIVVNITERVFSSKLKDIESKLSKFAKDNNARGILAIPDWVTIDINNIDASIKDIDTTIEYLNRAKAKLEKIKEKDNEKDM